MLCWSRSWNLWALDSALQGIAHSRDYQRCLLSPQVGWEREVGGKKRQKKIKTSCVEQEEVIMLLTIKPTKQVLFSAIIACHPRSDAQPVFEQCSPRPRCHRVWGIPLGPATSNGEHCAREHSLRRWRAASGKWGVPAASCVVPAKLPRFPGPAQRSTEKKHGAQPKDACAGAGPLPPPSPCIQAPAGPEAKDSDGSFHLWAAAVPLRGTSSTAGTTASERAGAEAGPKGHPMTKPLTLALPKAPC